jgi:diguanylate cyclase (GGDEF)-like protein
MKNIPADQDLRRSTSGRGRLLAVLDSTGADALETDPRVSILRGVWDGKPAVALVADPESPASRAEHESDLKSLHEISFELSLCKSVDEVCMNAVRLGRERLGFERLGAWLIDQKSPRWMIGTWSFDDEGRLRDERGSRLPRKLGGVPKTYYKGRLPLLFDDGAGGRLAAPLWDGHKIIGELCADDSIGRAAIGSEKRETFVIFARVVANLVSLKRAEFELRQLASTDALTGTVNRRTALIILEKHLAQCRRSDSPLTLCLADLDGLKVVNDAFGHAAGDEYIRRASSALVGAVRGSDTVGRIGGDEFIVIFPDCRGDVVASILERVNAGLAEGARGAKGGGAAAYLPRLSWGIASLGELAEGSGAEGIELQRCIDLLLELADQRMYDDKRNKGAARPKATGEAELAC